MKIALVSPYDFAYPGGVVNHIMALERHLTRMSHQVRVIAPASKAVSVFDNRLIPIGSPRPVPASGSIARVTLSLRLASRIKEVLAREKFDVIHLHEPFVPMLCSAVLRFSNTVNIGTFHATQSRPGYNFFAWPISPIMRGRRARKLDGKIAVSQAALEFASRYIPGPYEIIPNGIDLEHFSSDVPPIERFCDGKFNILFVGRLERRKGLNYLIKAYQQVKKEYPESRLIIVGPGLRPRKKHEKQVRRMGLGDVVFAGPVSYDELPSYYKTADIFCAPATGRESFGIVLLEAMALGKPVVASNIPGYASVVTHGKEGLLVPPKDVNELARTLMSLMADESQRQHMGARGLLTVRNYGWQQIAQRIEAYYHRILGEVPSAKRPPEHGVTSVPA